MIYNALGEFLYTSDEESLTLQTGAYAKGLLLSSSQRKKPSRFSPHIHFLASYSVRRFLFKKWLELEKKMGDEGGVELVKQKAVEWTQNANNATVTNAA
jgi:hypothetical protein